MSNSRDDIRYALRRIRREPTFAAFAVAIIAIGVAAVTAVFSVMSPLMLRPLLFGIGPTDAVSFVATAVVLVTVSALAGFLPARRAPRTDPMVALRSLCR